MEQALGVHRLHFAFTVTFHYIFPQLTMGLALLILFEAPPRVHLLVPQSARGVFGGRAA